MKHDNNPTQYHLMPQAFSIYNFKYAKDTTTKEMEMPKKIEKKGKRKNKRTEEHKTNQSN